MTLDTLSEFISADMKGQDDKVQRSIGSPAALTRLDQDSGDNIDINLTLLEYMA